MAFAARMMPFSSNVSAAGSSWSGSSFCSSAVTTNCRISAVESALERRDLIFDRARAGPHLQDGPREEASAWERVSREVVEEGVTDRDELREPGRRGKRRFDDLGVEDSPRFVHGRELELLLRTEVCVDAALAHAQGVGQVADRQAFEAVDRRQRHGLANDRFAGSFTIRSLLSGFRHVDKIARSVVFSGSHDRSCFFRPRSADVSSRARRYGDTRPRGSRGTHRRQRGLPARASAQPGRADPARLRVAHGRTR